MRPANAITSLVALLVGVSVGPSTAAAQAARAAAKKPAVQVKDVWSQLCPGVRYLHRTTNQPLSLHVIEVDLRTPGIRIGVTPRQQRWRTTSQFGKASGAVAAINGGFWSQFDSAPEGLVVHRGQRWPGTRDDEFFGFFGVTNGGRGVISPRKRVIRQTGFLREAISALQLLVYRGRVHKEANCFEGCRFRQPRSAIAVSKNGKKVWFVAVDGRGSHSRGLSLPDLGRFLISLGADRAINLDGGGSTALYVASRGGLVNKPADKSERVVLNHIGVFWKATPAQLAAIAAAKRRAEAKRQAASANDKPTAATGSGEAKPKVPELARPPQPTTAGVPTGVERWVQLHWREILSPRNLLIGVPFCLGLIVLLVWLRRRRRAARS